MPIADWPHRRLYHRRYRERWKERIFDAHPEAVRDTLDELRSRGPLESAEFSDRRSVERWQGSWYGPKLVKNVLRALWDSGEVVTHARRAGRHVYALPERVIPVELLEAPDPPRRTSLAHLLRRRVQSAGLLRPRADGALWNTPCDRRERVELIAEMLADGVLASVTVDGERYLATPEALAALDRPTPAGVRFVAPLDPLVWDRRGLAQLFGFEYLWEVYKPEAKRRWGYYVLPVWWRDRFVGRFDGRRDGTTLRVEGWWWEQGEPRGDDLLGELARAMAAFLRYLGADRVSFPRSRRRVPDDVRAALRGAA